MKRVLFLTENRDLEQQYDTYDFKNGSWDVRIVGALPEFIKELSDSSPDLCILHSDTSEKCIDWFYSLKQFKNESYFPVIFLINNGSLNQIPDELYQPLIDFLPSAISAPHLHFKMHKLLHLSREHKLRDTNASNNTHHTVIERLVDEISKNLSQHLARTQKNAESPHELVDSKNRLIELQKLLSTDLSVSQQSKEELFLSKKFYRQIFESVQDGIVLYDAESFQLIDFNTKAHSDLGYTREEFFNLKSEDFTEYEYKGQRAVVLSELMNNGSVKYRVRHKRKDGFLLTRIMHAQLLTFDQKKYILGILQDVSELIKKEDLIDSKENKIKELQNNIPVGMFSTEMDGKILYVNPFLIDLLEVENEKEILGSYARDFYLNQEDRETLIENLTKSDQITNYELQAKTLKGKKYWARMNIRLIRDAAGNPTRLDGTLEDITRQKKSEESLKEARQRIDNMNKELRKEIIVALKKHDRQQSQLIQKSKLESIGELAAGIAHEINQPLGIMSISFENLQTRLNAGTATPDYVDRKFSNINKNIERIQNIIDHIRIFSRDQEVPTLDKINVNKVVNSALSMLKAQYTNRNIQITADLEKDPGFSVGNKFKLEQALLNVLSNSRYALEDKAALMSEEEFTKKIEIKTWNESDKVGISIQDNGKGIRKKDQTKVFNPFYTTKPEGLGTGLGLSIALGIIKEMNGEIRLQSKWNHFTNVEIILPRFPEKN